MSYSFVVAVPTKEAAAAAIEAELDKVAAFQAIHKRDKDAALAAAAILIDATADPDPDQEISISVHGSLSWRGELKDDLSNEIYAASVGVSVHVMLKSPAT